MRLPSPRGALSAHVVETLRPGPAEWPPSPVADGPDLSGPDQSDPDHGEPRSEDLLLDDDFQLALWILYELHYRGFEDVDDDLEWDPLVLHARARLEEAFEDVLRALVDDDLAQAPADGSFADRLARFIDEVDDGDLATYLHRDATTGQFADYLRQRSLYQLKESDPQSFLLPRLDGPAKVALAELQYDEYGGGRPERLHSRLFGDAMQAMGLDRTYGAYVDRASATTLATNNVMSLFALHRRLRGAALGHLAAFEATSSLPCRRIVAGIERLGLPEDTSEYFDEHIEADAVHEQVAIRNICGEAVADEPELADDVLFGAACCLRLEQLSGADQLARWEHPEPTPPARSGRHLEALA